MGARKGSLEHLNALLAAADDNRKSLSFSGTSLSPFGLRVVLELPCCADMFCSKAALTRRTIATLQRLLTNVNTKRPVLTGVVCLVADPRSSMGRSRASVEHPIRGLNSSRNSSSEDLSSLGEHKPRHVVSTVN